MTRWVHQTSTQRTSNHGSEGTLARSAQQDLLPPPPQPRAWPNDRSGIKRGELALIGLLQFVSMGLRPLSKDCYRNPTGRNRSASAVVPASGAEPLSGAKMGRGRSAIRGLDRDAGIIVNSLEGHPLEGQGIQRSRFGNLNCTGHSEVVGDLTSSTFGLMNVRLKTLFRRVRQ